MKNVVYVASYFTRAFLFAFMVGRIVAAFVPSDKVQSLLSGKKVSSYFLATIFVPLFTVCSYATIPIFCGILIASFFGAIFIGCI